MLANHLHAGKETDEKMVDLFLFAEGDKKGLDLYNMVERWRWHQTRG